MHMTQPSGGATIERDKELQRMREEMHKMKAKNVELMADKQRLHKKVIWYVYEWAEELNVSCKPYV